MVDGSKLDKAIKSAIKFVSQAKRHSISIDIIDRLLRELKPYLKSILEYHSELEMKLNEKDYHQNALKHDRLKRIIQLYDGNPDLTIEEIDFLESIKDSTQFYSGNSVDYVLFKRKFIDIVLTHKMPDKKTRPTTIDQIEKSYTILTDKYANSAN